MPRTYKPKPPVREDCRWCGKPLPAKRRSDRVYCEDACRDAERNARGAGRYRPTSPGQTTFDSVIPRVSGLAQADIPGMPRELPRMRTVGVVKANAIPARRSGGARYSIRALVGRLGLFGAREAFAELPLSQQMELLSVSEDARVLARDILANLDRTA